MNSISLQHEKAPLIRFGKVAREDRNKSIEAGRKITYDVDMVYVKQVGERDETEQEAATWLKRMQEKAQGSNGNPPSIPMGWYEKFEKFYENWKKGSETPLDGFPVREWPILSPAQIANLHAMSTFTVEQIRDWTENAMGMYGVGGRELRDKARMWLDSADSKAEKLAAMQVENQALKDQIAALSEKFDALSKKVDDKPKSGKN